MNPSKKKRGSKQSNPAAKPLRPKYDSVQSDVLGSYTGAPFKDLEPIQDADDL